MAKLNLDKLSEAVKNLSEVDESFEDFFEELGILVDDIADMYKAKSSTEFNKQKKDARITFKSVKRKIDNLTFKQLKIAKNNQKKGD